MPLLRLQFIFLRKERFLTRAKRLVRHQPEPMLLNSYKGHLKAVNSLVFINLPKLLLSGSHDCSCRLWTLGGRYLGTLGTPLPWLKLSAFDTMPEDEEYRMPPDIKKVASSTTIKVISGVQDDSYKHLLHRSGKNQEEEAIDDVDVARFYGKTLKEPILGKHFKMSGTTVSEQTVVLDTSLSYIPVYSHLKIHDAQSIERPPTPPVLHRIENEEYIDYFTPDDLKDKIKKYRLNSKEDVLNAKGSGNTTKKSSRHDSAETRDSTKTLSDNRDLD